MRRAFDVASVRFAESETMELIPADQLMLRAARGLERSVVALLGRRRGRIVGARAVLLVGSGNNGGDTLFCGAFLARRGVGVDAICLGGQIHEAGSRALRRAGGRLHATDSEALVAAAASMTRRADVVLDGIVGIGGKGPLREPAATLARAAAGGGALRIAVDVPSGVDPDTGAVTDGESAFAADVTVTFGCLKSGLVLPPGCDYAGVLDLVDIGMEPQLASLPDVRLLQHGDVVPYFARPSQRDYKYTHGVVGVVAGSALYPGAAQLVTGAARHSGVGMVRFFDRGDAVADAVINRFPDVVAVRGMDAPASDPKATAWVIGSGAGTGAVTAADLASLLATELPLVIDADALTILAEDADLRRAVSGRSAATVLTPHEGEFVRLGFDLDAGRVAAAKEAAERLGVIMLLKGAGTVIAGPRGAVYVDSIGPPDLATAGTGDVLSGLICGLLARDHHLPSDPVRAVAAAVYLHGLAARRAVGEGRPLTAWDLVAGIPDAVAELRRGDDRVPCAVPDHR